jgi:hypothetical protein
MGDGENEQERQPDEHDPRCGDRKQGRAELRGDAREHGPHALAGERTLKAEQCAEDGSGDREEQDLAEDEPPEKRSASPDRAEHAELEAPCVDAGDDDVADPEDADEHRRD